MYMKQDPLEAGYGPHSQGVQSRYSQQPYINAALMQIEVVADAMKFCCLFI